MSAQPLLHEAEELGQNRAYTKSEAQALVWLAAVVGIWGACGGLLLGGCVAFLKDWPFISCALVGAAAGFTLAGVPILIKGVHEQLDGLRSWRKATSYVPVVPQASQPEPPSSPIVVYPPGGGAPYVLDRNEPLALPDGRQTALGLNPPTLAAVLQEVIQQHNGQWSRSRLMAIRVNGERITRKLYEDMTNALAKSGFLQPQPNGGYSVPPDVREFEDVFAYLPGLGGRDGGREGGKGEPSGDIPPSGVGESLAERRRQQWLECGCDVNVYRRKLS